MFSSFFIWCITDCQKLLSICFWFMPCAAFIIFNFHAKFDKILLTSKICQPSYLLLLIKVYKKGGIFIERILVLLIIENSNMRESFCISRLNKMLHFSPHGSLLLWETSNRFDTFNTILCYAYNVYIYLGLPEIRNIKHQLY